MTGGKALDVEFVDDGVAPGNSRGSVVSPLKRWIDHDAFRNRGGVAAIVAAQIFEPSPDPVAKKALVGANLTFDRPGVGVDQQLGGVEAPAVCGIVGSPDPARVALPGRKSRYTCVPNVIGPLPQSDDRAGHR